MKKMELRVRSWVYLNDVKFFGPGRAELLELVEDYGSIAKAAKAMGMSYKKAWAMIDAMNAGSKKPYVIAHKGGQKGGGTTLTENGKKIVIAYRKLTLKLQAVVDKETQLLKLL